MPELPTRVKSGVAAAAIVSLAGLAFYGRLETSYQEQHPDPYKVSAQFSRFADFRAAVPEASILGYMSDVDPDSDAAKALLNTAQYALAPRVLDKDHPHELVLGNFARQGDFTALGMQRGLRLERDFGNGVVLYRKDAH